MGISWRYIPHDRDIEIWIASLNEQWLHSSLGYRTPAEMRTTWQERMPTAV